MMLLCSSTGGLKADCAFRPRGSDAAEECAVVRSSLLEINPVAFQNGDLQWEVSESWREDGIPSSGMRWMTCTDMCSGWHGVRNKRGNWVFSPANWWISENPAAVRGLRVTHSGGKTFRIAGLQAEILPGEWLCSVPLWISSSHAVITALRACRAGGEKCVALVLPGRWESHIGLRGFTCSWQAVTVAWSLSAINWENVNWTVCRIVLKDGGWRGA